MPAQPELRVLRSPAELAQAAAVEFSRIAQACTQAGEKFTVALSGGSTPKTLFELLAFQPFLPWQNIYLFWGDERHVPPTDQQSNYRMAREALLTKVPIPPQNIFRIPAEMPDAAAAAGAYETTMRDFFRLQPAELPRFSLVMLGMGPDGHVASLFPGTQALQDREHLVVANWVEHFQTHRITLTLPVINRAAEVMFLVAGPDKASILREVLESPHSALPARQVRPENGRLLWFVDGSAASTLLRPPAEAS